MSFAPQRAFATSENSAAPGATAHDLTMGRGSRSNDQAEALRARFAATYSAAYDRQYELALAKGLEPEMARFVAGGEASAEARAATGVTAIGSGDIDAYH
jgi:hypothetical protein